MFKKSIKILGIHLGEQNDELDKENIESVLEKMESTVQEYLNRDLSYIGRVLISKSLILSQLIYKINILHCRQSTLKRVQKLIHGFIWKGNDKIKRILGYKDYSDGGLRTPNFIAVCKAIDCIWIKRLVNPRMHKWKWFALLELENIGGLSFLNGKLQRAAIKNIKCSSFKNNLKSWSESFPEPMTMIEWGNQSLWKNSFIRDSRNNKPLFFKSLYDKGFKTVKDILNGRGFIDPFCQNLNLSDQETQRLQIVIDSVSLKLAEYFPFNEMKWIGQRNLNFLLHHNGKTKELSEFQQRDFYWIIIDQINFETVPIIERFEENLGIPKSDWYLVCEQTKMISKSTKLRSDFFRSNHKLLFSNSTKHKMGVINYSRCHFCPEENQTEEHMLFNCPVVHTFWNLVRLKYVDIFRTPITEYEAIIGATDENSQLRLRKNIILLHGRMEIYSANNNKKNLDIEKLEMKISDHYKLESANNSEKRHQEVEELFDFLNW